MSTLGSTWLNLIDAQKMETPKGGMWPIAELLSMTNPILDDAIAVECNSGREHQTSIRTGLPTVAWGAIYQGIPQSKSSRQNIKDATGFVEGMSSVDTRLLALYKKNENAMRLQEAQAYIESMNQEMATSMFYADTATTPEKFKGLGARYGTLGTSGAGRQIIDAGGTGGDLTSIWFVTWSPNATHLIYPEGTPAGLEREDKGEQRVLEPGTSNPYFVKEELFRWHIGMSVRDWRYNVRIANISAAAIADGSLDLYALMRKAYYRLQSRRQMRPASNFGKGGALKDETIPMSRIAIYCNSDVLEALDAAGTNARPGTHDNFTRLQMGELDGREVTMYRKIPIRECDALLSTEARVV